YADAQERMSDPAVFSDRQQAAEAGRRLKELEGPYKLAQEWRSTHDGHEAANWAGDLYRMLTRYAESRDFKWEVLGSNPSESGGYNDITFAVKGEGAYSIFKWEGGTHRVQRVPVTESQGRIHTSTATVAVMPEAEEVEIEI